MGMCGDCQPRVENEMLTPYRSFFKKVISKEEAGEFIKEPIRLVEWCKKEIQINNELNSQRIPMSADRSVESACSR